MNNNAPPRRSRRIAPQMLEVIHSVLRRLQNEMLDVDDSDYEPSTEDDELDDELDLEPLTKAVIFKKNWDSGDCPICLDAMSFRQHGIELKCGHMFHKKCVLSWLERDASMRCPTCRTPTISVARPVLRRSRRIMQISS